MLIKLLCSLFVLIPLVDLSFFDGKQNPIYSVLAAKWVALYIFSLFALAWVFLKEKIIQLKFHPATLKILLFYALSLLIVIVSAPKGYLERSLSEKFLFCFIALWANIVFFEEEKLLVTLRKWVFWGAPFIYAFGFYGLATDGSLYLFKNPHPFGECVALLTIIQAFFIFRKSQASSKAQRPALEFVVFALSFVLLIWLKSRTAILGTGLAMAWMLFQQFKSGIKVKEQKFFKVALSLVVLFGAIFVFLNLQQYKLSNLNARVIMWSNTAKMISENPLGAGLGNFFSSYSGYQNATALDPHARENSIIENPHNSFLDNAAEEGIISAFILIFLLGFTLRAFLKLKNKEGTHSLLMGLVIFLLIDALFNNPHDTALTFMAMAFCFGALNYKIGQEQIQVKIKDVALGVGLACGVFLLAIPAKYYTAFYWGKSKNIEVLRKACALDSQVWTACISVMSDDWAKGRREEALTEYERVEARFKGHFVLRRKIIEFLWLVGDKKNSCEQALIYDELFGNKSSLREFIVTKCSN